jgi:rhodanese-related sulfurtransferase
MSYQSTTGYAGDLLSVDAYSLLASDAASILIDVRTRAEWTYVGTPDIQAIGKAPYFLEWQNYPSMQVDQQFASRLGAILKSAGVELGSPLVFLCRSGARSRHAAIAMSGAGWTPCYNVSDGFEGPPDDSRRRGGVCGWKAAGLPWVQS